MLKIVTVPNKILNSPVRPVKKIDSKIINLIKEMEKTLNAQVNPQGVGLAAPQVGANLALFIIKPTPEAETEVFINPQIIKQESYNIKRKTTSKVKQKTKLEGCLSLPKIWSPVKRAEKIFLQYQTPTAKVVRRWFSGFKAVIIQHEVDHLQGVLFTQRALEQKASLYEEKEGKLHKLEF